MLLAKGTKVQVNAGKRTWTGTIVDILQADVMPDPEKVRTYYGQKQFKHHYKIFPRYRIVIQKPNNHYLIVPLNFEPENRFEILEVK